MLASIFVSAVSIYGKYLKDNNVQNSYETYENDPTVLSEE